MVSTKLRVASSHLVCVITTSVVDWKHSLSGSVVRACDWHTKGQVWILNGSFSFSMKDGLISVHFNVCTFIGHKFARRCAIYSMNFLAFITVQYIEKTLHKLAHHWNHLTIICYDKTYRKSLQWFSWKEAIISPSLQERVCFTDYMKKKGEKQRICLIQNNNNNNNKNSILPSGGNRWMSSSTDQTFTRYTWWEIRNSIVYMMRNKESTH